MSEDLKRLFSQPMISPEALAQMQESIRAISVSLGQVSTAMQRDAAEFFRRAGTSLREARVSDDC